MCSDHLENHLKLGVVWKIEGCRLWNVLRSNKAQQMVYCFPRNQRFVADVLCASRSSVAIIIEFIFIK